MQTSPYRIHWSAILMVIAVLAAVHLPATSRATEAGFSEANERYLSKLGEGVIGERIDLGPITDARKTFGLTEGTAQFKITAGEHKGQSSDRTIKKIRRKGGREQWAVHDGDRSILALQITEHHDVLLPSEVELTQSVISKYEPQEKLLLTGMKAGQSREYQMNVKVFDLHDPSWQKYTGKLSVRWHYVGDYQLKTPAGEFKARLIKTSYKGSVGPADVDDVAFMFYADEVGLVAAVDRQHVSAFLLYNKTTQSARILSVKPKP